MKKKKIKSWRCQKKLKNKIKGQNSKKKKRKKIPMDRGDWLAAVQGVVKNWT